MDKIEVGRIEDYPVIYVPEKKLVFCKNTIVPLDEMKKILHSGTSKHRIERANLPITKFANTIELGCLTTTISNLKEIEKQIDNYD